MRLFAIRPYNRQEMREMLNETPSSGTHYVAPVLEELGSFQEETGFFGFHGRESILVVPYKW